MFCADSFLKSVYRTFSKNYWISSTNHDKNTNLIRKENIDIKQLTPQKYKLDIESIRATLSKKKSI